MLLSCLGHFMAEQSNYLPGVVCLNNVLHQSACILLHSLTKLLNTMIAAYKSICIMYDTMIAQVDLQAAAAAATAEGTISPTHRCAALWLTETCNVQCVYVQMVSNETW